MFRKPWQVIADQWSCITWKKAQLIKSKLYTIVDEAKISTSARVQNILDATRISLL